VTVPEVKQFPSRDRKDETSPSPQPAAPTPQPAPLPTAPPPASSQVAPADARERFEGEDQDYKVELIEDLVLGADSENPLETVSLYTNGPFTDLCRGPHAPSTKSVGAFKLTSVAGAYWRGDSTRTMLTRIRMSTVLAS